MSKSIQIILIILLLILLGGGGYFLFSKRGNKTVQVKPIKKPVTSQPVGQPADSVIKQVDFNEDSAGKKIVITELQKKNYRVRLSDTGDGFSVLFPGTNLNVEAEHLNPLPWIHSVQFEEKEFRGQPSVEMSVSTIDDLAMFDKFENNALTIVLQNAGGTGQKLASNQKTVNTPTQSTQAKPVKRSSPKPKAKKSAPKPKTVRTPTQSPPDPKPIEEPIVFEDIAPIPDNTFSDTDLAGIEDLSESFGSQEDFGETLEGSTFDGGSDSQMLDEDVSLIDLETDLSLGDGLEELGSTDVAAIGPGEGGFDMGQAAQTSMIQGMLISSMPNGRTQVRFDRERAMPYKIFKLRNPARLVVDFKDAKSGFDGSAVQGLGGSAIDKVETQEFESNDSNLLRVIMFVKGDVEFLANKDGNALVVEIP